MRNRTARSRWWIPILSFALFSCETREAAKPSSGAADSGAGTAAADTAVAEAAADSTLGMTRSTPAWLSGSDTPALKLSREGIVALAPAEIRLQDLGFSPPAVLPDTTGLKYKAKVKRKWAEALMEYRAGHLQNVPAHLAEARKLAPMVKDPDEFWPFRFRNLEAGALYSTALPGETKRVFGEIAELDRDDIFDVGYEWVMAMDDLRQGNGRDAAVRLSFIARSPHKISMEALRILTLLAPEAVEDSSDA